MTNASQATKAPRNRMAADARRHQLAEVAAAQFHHAGFHRVTVADIASAVGLTPPAIYRHFANKQELLRAAVDTGLRRVEEVFEADPDAAWPARVQQLADAAADRRDVWVLLQREMRHVDADDRRPLERRFAHIAARVRSELLVARPDLDVDDARLLVTALLASLSSQSTYAAHHPADERRRILGRLVLDLSATALLPGAVPAQPTSGGVAAPPAGDHAATRGETLLAAAIRLFHERGFEAVLLDDIGAEVGMAGPSVLHHFPTKADLLVSAFARASEQLASASSGTQRASLEDYVRFYVDFGVRERLLFGVYILEAASLPPDIAREIATVLGRDVAAWREALRAERPELTEAELTIVVHAARAIVHDVIRIGRLHDRPGIREELNHLVLSALRADLTGTTSRRHGHRISSGRMA